MSKVDLAENTVTIGGLSAIAALFLGFETLFMVLAAVVILLIVWVVVLESRSE